MNAGDPIAKIRRRLDEQKEHLALLHRDRDVDAYLAVCRSFNQEMAEHVPTLIIEIARLRAAVIAPLTAEQVTAALHEGHAERKIAEGENAWVSIVRQRDQFRAALAEALNIFDATWCPEHGHAPKQDQLNRIDELRKLVKP